MMRQTSSKRFIALLFCLLSFASNGLAEQEKAKATESRPRDSEYRIGSENVIQVDVSYGKDGQISQKIRVSSRGKANFPLLGDLKVVGMTVTDLQNRVKMLLERDYLVNPQVNIYIEEYSTVSIIGEVRKPGSYPMKGRLTILELIALAEGLTPVANSKSVSIIRVQPDKTKRTIHVELANLIAGGGQGDVQLSAGDVVVVSKSFF